MGSKMKDSHDLSQAVEKLFFPIILWSNFCYSTKLFFAVNKHTLQMETYSTALKKKKTISVALIEPWLHLHNFLFCQVWYGFH